MYIRKICVLIFVMFFSFSAICGYYNENIRSRLRGKGFTDQQISRTEGYLSAMSSPLTDAEKKEAQEWMDSEEKRLGRKLTEAEKKNYTNIVKRESRNLNYYDEIKPVLEATKEMVNENRKEEGLSERIKKWFFD